MAPLRVLFLMIMIVTVVTVTSGRDVETRGSSKYKLIQHHAKDSKLGLKVKGLKKMVLGSPHAEKAKVWGKSAQTKLKGVGENHPGIKGAGVKLFSTVKGMKSTGTSKARGVSTSTKVKKVISDIDAQLRKIQKKIMVARTVAKMAGLTNSVTKKRGLDTKTDKIKSAVKSGSDTLSVLRDKGSAKLASIKNSNTLNGVQKKLPASSLDALKKVPGADRLKSALSSTDTSTFKGKLAAVKSLAAASKTHT